MTRFLLGALFLALVPGCSEPPPPTVDVMPTFSDINERVFQLSCSKFSGCHNKTYASIAGNLNLADDPYKALLGMATDGDAGVPGVLADNAKAKREGLLRVKPGDPDHSFLIKKLELAADTDPKSDYGARMPQSNPAMPANVIAAIRLWITNGALKN